MAIITEKFYIPDEDYIKILTGTYKRFGGVVRDANGGQIVEFLKSATDKVGDAAGAVAVVKKAKNFKHAKPIAEKVGRSVPKAKNVVRQGAKLLKVNKKVALAVGAVTVVVAGSAVVVKKISEKELHNFRKSLRVYLNEIREGTLNLDTIKKMQGVVSDMSSDKYNSELIDEKMPSLNKIIREYTIKLLSDNNIPIYYSIDITETNPINDFKRCLEIQENIFEQNMSYV